MLNDYLKSPRDVRLELAERAKAERLRQNLTQEALAHAAGTACPRSGALKRPGTSRWPRSWKSRSPAPHGRVRRLFPEPPVHSLFEAAPRERQAREEADAS